MQICHWNTSFSSFLHLHLNLSADLKTSDEAVQVSKPQSLQSPCSFHEKWQPGKGHARVPTNSMAVTYKQLPSMRETAYRRDLLSPQGQQKKILNCNV